MEKLMLGETLVLWANKDDTDILIFFLLLLILGSGRLFGFVLFNSLLRFLFSLTVQFGATVNLVQLGILKKNKIENGVLLSFSIYS